MPRSQVGSPGTRASWRGAVRFGLVAFTVEAVNAVAPERDGVSFHQLHAECHSRIKYEKVCPIHGAVPNSEIVKAYEYAKGKYVEMDSEEIDTLRATQDKALTIEAFVSPEDVDPIYFDGRRYILVPDAASREPYAVFLSALERSEKFGVGKVVFSGREHPAIVRPGDGALHLAILSFAEDIRPAAEIVGELPSIKSTDKTLKLAETLIANWGEDDFDWKQYRDEYEQKVRKLVEAKVEHREIVAPPDEEEAPQVVNLMDALRKSIAGKSAKAAPAKRATSARTKKKRRAS